VRQVLPILKNARRRILRKKRKLREQFSRIYYEELRLKYRSKPPAPK